MRRNGDYASVGVLMFLLTFVFTSWTLRQLGRFGAHGGDGFITSLAAGLLVGGTSAWVSYGSRRWQNIFGIIIAVGLGAVVISLVAFAIRG